MRICLLTTQDLDTEPFPKDDWPCDPRPFLPDDTWHVATLKKKTSVMQVTRLVRDGFDLFFNLCDGAADQDVPGIKVVRVLEEYGVPFTGATSEFYEPSREDMKRACRDLGLDTPSYVLARSEADVARAAAALRFPLFVKHYSSYASVDLSRHSRVRGPAGLRRQTRKMLTRHGAALIEEFIDGVECTVLVAENPDDPLHPRTYTPIQYRFPAGESFKHAKLKWVDYDKLSSFPVADPALAARLREASARFFVALGGASFGRCDFRVDRAGTPYMLEINPNCGVYYPPTDPGSADICLAHDPEGHAGFTRRLVTAAMRRHKLRTRSADKTGATGDRAAQGPDRPA
ncbi:D-alanine--D-alanine ligase [bacterium]|nr:D-alanine--D-alanine ligase [bacterium]MBU1074143.1 D-alanine--D-alanine ligase [bacterium]MBU1676426.1 D-alanine--D-alanine ligase [bacterium]